MTEEEGKAFLAIIESIKETRMRKSHDYGNSWKIFGLRGVLYQIASKFIRLWNLTIKGKEPKNEPIRDTLLDMANYAIMGVQLLDMGKIEDTLIEFDEGNKDGK